MTVPSIPIVYGEATPAALTEPGAGAAQPLGPSGEARSTNWTRVVRGVATLGEVAVIALAFPFVVLALGLPILLVRLVIDLFRALLP